MKRGGALTGLALLSIAGVHCQTEDIIVAEIPATPDGGEHMHHSAPCTGSADCHASEFCDKSSCDAQVGRCHRRPIFCPGGGPRVCGCDGVTYWNDCLRQTGGVASSTPGECTSGATCGGSAALACPVPGASCARLFPGGDSCTTDTAGTCWVLPPLCPGPVPGEAAWVLCSDPRRCADACSAIRAEVPYRRLPGPKCPP